MSARTVGIATSVILGAFLIACGSSSSRSGFGTDTDSTEPDSGGTFGDNKNTNCGSTNDPNADHDGDGYPVKFDCNDCDPNINNGALDIPGNGVDEDCNGQVDDEAAPDDDANIDMDTTDAFEGARAMGLWKRADPDGRDWGVVEAEWVLPDGKKLKDLTGVGVLSSFGVNNPPQGASMLVLSSGTARAPGDTGYKATGGHGDTSGTPDGYPKESPACSGSGFLGGDAYDGTALQVKLRVPSNAKSFSYQQYFFTKEYPNFICMDYNDFFVTMMDPIPAGQEDGNIAYDQDTNPISVNNSFLQVCAEGNHGGRNFTCPLGNADLQGTGFTGAGATGWLTTTAPVEPGSEITLTFAIWDSGDSAYDSTVLLDDFKFSLDEAKGALTKPTGPK